MFDTFDESAPTKVDYSKAIAKLKEMRTMEKISQRAKVEYKADLLLCKKKDGNPEFEIQFLIDEAGLLEASALIDFIQNTIGYSNVVVQPKSLFSQESLEQLFSEVILYSEKTAERIEKTLDSDLLDVEEPLPSYFFQPASAVSKAPDKPSETVLAQALRLMELAVADDPKNLEIIVEKAKELGSPKSGLEK